MSKVIKINLIIQYTFLIIESISAVNQCQRYLIYPLSINMQKSASREVSRL